MQSSVNVERFKYLGGSDIPVVMELSPFNTRYNLLLEKAGFKENEFSGNVYTDYGNEMEPQIRDYINGALKFGKFKENKKIVELPGAPLNIRCHTDGETNTAVLEIKTTGTIYNNLEDYKIYLVQLLFYMMIAEKSEGVLAVYHRPDDLSTVFNPDNLQTFHINIDNYADVIEEIKTAIKRFFEDLEKVKQNPFITEEELLPQEIPEIARRIMAFEEQLKYYKETERKAAAEKERLKTAMEYSGVKSWTTPNGYKITLVEDQPEKTETKNVFNESRLQQERPRIYKQYVEEITQIKKGRKGYIKITEPKNKEA